MNDKTTARLRWSCRRGMRELDFWFNAYLDNTYPTATRQDQQDFEQLLEFHDQDLFDWLMGNTLPTNKDLLPLIESIRLSACQPDKAPIPSECVVKDTPVGWGEARTPPHPADNGGVRTSPHPTSGNDEL